MKKFDVILIEKPLDEGFTAEELISMQAVMKSSDEEMWVPVDLTANNSSAMGFIGVNAAEILNYDYSGLWDFVTNILNDMDLENEAGEYFYKTGSPDDIVLNISLKRNY